MPPERAFLNIQRTASSTFSTLITNLEILETCKSQNHTTKIESLTERAKPFTKKAGRSRQVIAELEEIASQIRALAELDPNVSGLGRMRREIQTFLRKFDAVDALKNGIAALGDVIKTLNDLASDPDATINTDKLNAIVTEIQALIVLIGDDATPGTLIYEIGFLAETQTQPDLDILVLEEVKQDLQRFIGSVVSSDFEPSDLEILVRDVLLRIGALKQDIRELVNASVNLSVLDQLKRVLEGILDDIATRILNLDISEINAVVGDIELLIDKIENFDSLVAGVSDKPKPENIIFAEIEKDIGNLIAKIQQASAIDIVFLQNAGNVISDQAGRLQGEADIVEAQQDLDIVRGEVCPRIRATFDEARRDRDCTGRITTDRDDEGNVISRDIEWPYGKPTSTCPQTRAEAAAAAAEREKKRRDDDTNGNGNGNGDTNGNGNGVGSICLVYDTLVLMSNGTYKVIQEIEVGDRVKGFDINTGKAVNTTVIDTLKDHPRNDYYVINNELNITNDHPVALLEKNSIVWRRTDELQIGDKIKSISGIIEVKSIEISRTQATTANLYTELGNFIAQGKNGGIYVVKSDY